MDRFTSLVEHALERVDGNLLAYASFLFEVNRGGVVLHGPVHTLLFDGDGSAIRTCELGLDVILRILVLLVEVDWPAFNCIVAGSYGAALLEDARFASACKVRLIHRHVVHFLAGASILGWRTLRAF